MTNKASIFEKTYRDYIAQVARIDFKPIEQKLRVEVKGNDVTIPLFGKPHKVSERGITDPSGNKPSLDICVILCKYLLMCPDVYPKEKEWVSFRDFKDSGPLTSYFTNDVERAIATYFGGRLDDMKEASKLLGGYPPDMEVTYDLSMQFDAFPRVPVMLLFHLYRRKMLSIFPHRIQDPSIAVVGAPQLKARCYQHVYDSVVLEAL